MLQGGFSTSRQVVELGRRLEGFAYPLGHADLQILVWSAVRLEFDKNSYGVADYWGRID